MHLVLSLLTVQVVLGFFDNLWHHEITERLPAKRAARVELALHALREWIYAFVFLAIAWWSWHGAWSWLLGGLLLIEIVTTLTDFVVEDTTRRLPKLERMLHTVLAINFGAILALLAPTLVAWSREPTAIVPSGYGAWSWFFAACSAGVLAWGARDALAALRHFRPAAWQRRKLVTAQAPRSKRILVTGATGFIGRELTYRLIERGDRVIVLTRDRDKAIDLFGPHAQIVTNLAVLPNDGAVDAIVNLAGAGIADAAVDGAAQAHVAREPARRHGRVTRARRAPRSQAAHVGERVCCWLLRRARRRRALAREERAASDLPVAALRRLGSRGEKSGTARREGRLLADRPRARPRRRARCPRSRCRSALGSACRSAAARSGCRGFIATT